MRPDGRIQQVGKPQDVYRAPANPFVANFIGMNNLVAGTVAAKRDGAVEIAGKAVVVPGDPVVDSYRRKLSMAVF